MKNLFYFMLTLFCSGVIITSCSDDFENQSQSSISTRSDEDPDNQTVKENPFTVSNMNLAFRELYGQSGNLSATHKYIKFSPSGLEELKALVEEDLDLWEDPIDGNEPQINTRPTRTEQDLGDFYAVVTPSFTSEVPFEVLADLYLGDNDSDLIEKAYKRLGYDPEEEGYFYSDPEDGTLAPQPEGYNPNPGNGPHYDGDLIIDGNCDCKQGIDKRNPAGCITLEDNRLSDGNCDKAVRHVKVILKNNWFSSTTVFTDKFGCFKRLKKYKGKLWMWVEFENAHVTVRGVEGTINDFLNYVLPVKDYAGAFKGPNFNNLNICYSYPSSLQGNAMRYWRAAMINNGVFEFRDWSSANNLTMPVADLKVLMTPFDDSGAAPMIDKIFDITGTTLPVDNQYGDYIFGLGSILNGTLFEGYLSAFAPDLVFNTRGIPQSDRLKNTIYHELAHAQHFTRLGYPNINAVDYWMANINYIVDNLGYGDGTAPGAPRAQVIENWGWTMGPTIAHDAYGDDASVAGGHNCQMESRVFVNGHIQAGWLNDIHDYREPGCQDAVIDNCNGYEHFKFLSLMDVNTLSPAQFRNKFQSIHLNPNDSEVYIQLCAEYGL